MGPPQLEDEQTEKTFWEIFELSSKTVSSWRQNGTAALQTLLPLVRSVDHELRAQFENETKRLDTLDVQLKDYAAKQNDQTAFQELLTLDDNRAAALQKRVTELCEILQRQKPLVAERVAESKEAIDQKRRKDSSTRDVIRWYEREVGFRVETSKNKALKFIFTKLSPTDMNREFSFTIRHDKQTDLYTMLECSPQVACSDELMNELNFTNNLHKFALQVRSEFQRQLQN